MPTLKRISASLVASPSRLALAASLIWIPLAMGVSAHAQTAEQESELATKVSAPVIPQQVRYSGKLATRTLKPAFAAAAAKSNSSTSCSITVTRSGGN